MLKVLAVIIASILLSSCGPLPGMGNLNTAQMGIVALQKIPSKGTLIPITSALIASESHSTYTYHVKPFDVLLVEIWRHPEFHFSGQPYVVGTNGQIVFPLIGHVLVADKTVEEIRTILTTRLKPYVVDPQVLVSVSNYRGQKIYVLGEVINPGILPIQDQPLTIADALALSGGMNPNKADARFIYVIRGSDTQKLIFWLNATTPDRMLLAEGFRLQSQDILYVSSTPWTRFKRMF